MKYKKVTSSFAIGNTELEKYSFNLVHYFLDKQDYAIFNFEEKILENFNHDYYNIVIVYSKPLVNEVHYETLLEKLTIIKKKLRKKFFLFNQRILVLATNCSMDLTKMEAPQNIDMINASEQEILFQNEIIQQVYPDLESFSLDLTFDVLSYKLNSLSIVYAKKIGSIFNKKGYFINILLAILLMLPYVPYLWYTDSFNKIKIYLLLTHDNIAHFRYYTLLTNNFNETYLYLIIIDIFLIISLGFRIEKIFGSIRYAAMLVVTMVFSNAFIFAFVPGENYLIGFTPVIYAYIGIFIYVILMFRRFLAYIIHKMFGFSIIFILMIFLFGRAIDFYLLIGGILSGFASAFIVGIPKVKNGTLLNRGFAFIFLGILTVLSLSIGLK